MCRRVLFLVIICWCPWDVLGEWYHLNQDSGYSTTPNVVMSMRTFTIENATDGTFYYVKNGTAEHGRITRTHTTLSESTISSSDAPGYNSPSLNLDGETYINLGDQTDSCFDNLTFCPNGWTIGFWVKNGQATTSAFLDSGAGTGKSGFVFAYNEDFAGFYTGVTTLVKRTKMYLPETVNAWYHMLISVDANKQRYDWMVTYPSGERTLLTASFVYTTGLPLQNPRFVLGATAFSLDHRAIGQLDELAVWYHQLDVTNDGSVFLSQTALASVCSSDSDCSSLNFASCMANTEWGTDRYCQCKGGVTYEPAYNDTSSVMVSMTVQCDVLPRCRIISKDDVRRAIIAAEEKRKAQNNL